MKTVLILGAGRVSAPCVDYLARKGGCRIVIADLAEKNLADVEKRFPGVVTVREDAAATTAKLIGEHAPTVVLNLLPPECMPGVSKTCLDTGVHMIHPAYTEESTKKMAPEVARAGLVFITELGLDPGIDHMSAAMNIDDIHARGGGVESFQSLCGALPSAAANTNPWGYKLSWSPASLIGASKRTAKILRDGREILWPDGETYAHCRLYDVPRLGTFEVYANADSTRYKEGYGIPEAKTIYRGTLRYPGWCETICYMNAVGFFETDVRDVKGATFADFTARLMGGDASPEAATCARFGLRPWSAFVQRMRWLGFFDERPLPFERASARDVVAFLFDEKLVFAPEEKDLVVLCDEIVASYPDGTRELRRSLLVDYGIPGKWSSVARTTGVPPAIAARFILEGVIATPGVHAPTTREIYEPVLRELAAEGIVLQETAETIG